MDKIIKIVNGETKCLEWVKNYFLWYLGDFFVQLHLANPKIHKFSNTLKKLSNDLDKKLFEKYINIYTINPSEIDLVFPKMMMNKILLENKISEETLFYNYIVENHLIKTLEENASKVLRTIQWEFPVSH